MKALQVTRNGPPGEVLEVVDVPVPEPGLPDQIDLREWKGAFTLAVAGALSDPVEKRVEIRRTEIEAMRVLQGGSRDGLVHLF